MTGDEMANEIWYQANLEACRKCAAWREEIARREESLRTLDAQRPGLEQQTKAQLVEQLQDRGTHVRRFAQRVPKSTLIEWMIIDQAINIRHTIATLEKLIKENRPDPRWRMRPEENNS